jgi:2-C-methyl-D-erythritol 4-phosphate cytidylyltransferase
MIGPFDIARGGVHFASTATLRTLDAVLDSPLTEAMVDRVLASRLAEHVVATALRGPLIDTAIAAAAPRAEAIADQALDSPAAERLVARVIEGRLLDEAVARLLESEDLWILVDEIARSPAVTDAISHQGMGLADEMGAVVRRRSSRADTRLENAARRILGRARHAAGPAPEQPV